MSYCHDLNSPSVLQGSIICNGGVAEPIVHPIHPVNSTVTVLNIKDGDLQVVPVPSPDKGLLYSQGVTPSQMNKCRKYTLRSKVKPESGRLAPGMKKPHLYRVKTKY